MLQYPRSLVFLRNLYPNVDTIFYRVWKRAYLLSSFLLEVERTVYSLTKGKQLLQIL